MCEMSGMVVNSSFKKGVAIVVIGVILFVPTVARLFYM